MSGATTRRKFLAAGAVILGGGAAGYGLARERGGPFETPRPSPPVGGPRKCLSMGPINAPDGDDQDLRVGSNLADAIASGSDWVKLWIRWDQVQPLPADRLATERLGEPGNPGLPFLVALDAQVELARSQDPPLGVVITSWFFPTWSNGTDRLAAGSAEERRFGAEDRLTREQFEAGDPSQRRTLLTYRPPPMSQLGPDGPWGRWTRFLLERYARHGEGVMVEVMNEPNLQWWPQQAPAAGADPFATGALLAPATAARMLATAQEVSGASGSGVLVGGPGVSDYPAIDPVREDRRTFTTYASFVTATLDALDELDFEASPRFVWTHHNYVDALLDLGADAGTRNRAAHVRELISGRWSGWPGESDPEVWLTEGGVDLRSRRVRDDQRIQARLVGRNLGRMADRDRDGAGIGMVCNYLNYTEDHYDTGLRATLAAGGTPRPVAKVWRDLR